MTISLSGNKDSLLLLLFPFSTIPLPDLNCLTSSFCMKELGLQMLITEIVYFRSLALLAL